MNEDKSNFSTEELFLGSDEDEEIDSEDRDTKTSIIDQENSEEKNQKKDNKCPKKKKKEYMIALFLLPVYFEKRDDFMRYAGTIDMWLALGSCIDSIIGWLFTNSIYLGFTGIIGFIYFSMIFLMHYLVLVRNNNRRAMDELILRLIIIKPAFLFMGIFVYIMQLVLAIIHTYQYFDEMTNKHKLFCYIYVGGTMFLLIVHLTTATSYWSIKKIFNHFRQTHLMY